MFYDEAQAIKACEDEPSLIFELIKEGHIELVDKILKNKIVSLNEVDLDGNTVLMKLLKLKQYKIVEKYIGNSEYLINHQNNDGNTFTHILATKDYLHTANIIRKVKRNKLFSPNIRNNDGYTILDLAVNSGNLSTSLKFLEDKRLNDIDVLTFVNLYKMFIKNDRFGKYTKLTNFETIISELSKKSKLLPKVEELIISIKNDYNNIKNEIMSNNLTVIDNIMNNVLMEVRI